MAISLAGCPGDEQCGVTGAVDDAITISGGGIEATFATFDACPCNDCPATGQIPGEGITSVTIAGEQVGAVGFFTLCIGRPDQLNGGLALGNAEQDVPVRVEDLSGSVDGCTFRVARATPPAGTAKATGACDNASHPDGFTLELSGDVMLERTCGPDIDTVAVTLSGRVAVEALQR